MSKRTERKEKVRIQHRFVAQLPAVLTRVPEWEFPAVPDGFTKPIEVWRSKKYLVQIFDEQCDEYPDMVRLSINRSTLGLDERWEDGLTWDELQTIKREVGFGDWYAIEVYPRDSDVVNVANIRHLWLLKQPLKIGWMKEGGWPDDDEYPDEDAQDPNDGNWCPECGEMRQLCQCSDVAKQ